MQPPGRPCATSSFNVRARSRDASPFRSRLCSYGGVDRLWSDETDEIKTAACFDGGLGPDADVDACHGRNGNQDRVNQGTCTETFDGSSHADRWEGDIHVEACCRTHSDAGCAPHWNDAVEQCVCERDDYCCSVAWDSLCVNEVESFGCGSCSSDLEYNGCYDVCQYEVDDIRTDDRWVIPPLFRIMEDAEGPDWWDRFARPIYI